MATRYTSTIHAKAWKEHTCNQCGAVYSYLLARKVVGQATSAAKAEEIAHRNVEKTMTREVDHEPCPGCGLLQPDMIGQSRARWHLRLFWVTLIATPVILILRASYAVQANTLTVAAVVVTAVIAAVHFYFDTKNPNRDPDGNRRAAGQKVTAGAIRHTPGRPVSGTQMQTAGAPRSAIQMAALALLGGSVVLVALPEIVRNLQGWPANEASYPPVTGPGDTARIYMDDKITSVKGYWNGRPEVTVQGPHGEPINANATTNQNSWGSTISAKSSEKNNSSTPWVEVAVPDDATLAGQRIQCNIELNVDYPSAAGSSSFEVEHRTMHKRAELQLSPAHAGATYNGYWWQGTAGGLILLLICGQILRSSARSLQLQARPTRLYT